MLCIKRMLCLLQKQKRLTLYSANVELAIEVATALYKVGVPLLIRDAEKLLRILREEDYVRLIPNTYHNYIGYQEEGTVYEPVSYTHLDVYKRQTSRSSEKFASISFLL